MLPHSGPFVKLHAGIPARIAVAEARDNQEFGGILSAKQHDWETDTTWSEKDSWSSIMTPRFLANLVGVRDKECRDVGSSGRSDRYSWVLSA